MCVVGLGTLSESLAHVATTFPDFPPESVYRFTQLRSGVLREHTVADQVGVACAVGESPVTLLTPSLPIPIETPAEGRGGALLTCPLHPY